MEMKVAPAHHSSGMPAEGSVERVLSRVKRTRPLWLS